MKRLFFLITLAITTSINCMLPTPATSGNAHAPKIDALRLSLQQHIADNNYQIEQLRKCRSTLSTFTKVSLGPVIEELGNSIQKLETQNTSLTHDLGELALIKAQVALLQVPGQARTSHRAANNKKEWDIRNTVPEELKNKYFSKDDPS